MNRNPHFVDAQTGWMVGGGVNKVHVIEKEGRVGRCNIAAPSRTSMAWTLPAKMRKSGAFSFDFSDGVMRAFAIDPERGRQVEPVWRSNRLAAWSRMNSKALRLDEG